MLAWRALRFNTIVIGLRTAACTAGASPAAAAGPGRAVRAARAARPRRSAGAPRRAAVDRRSRPGRVGDRPDDRRLRVGGRQARRGLPADEARVIDLARRDGRVLRIGHRGAATLAPENTLRSFRAAVEVGVDLIEFDVLDLPRGPLVLAHSDHLDEVSHGAAGRPRARAARSPSCARSRPSCRPSTRRWRSSSTRRRTSGCTSISSCAPGSTSSRAALSRARARASARSSATSTCRACARSRARAPRRPDRLHLPGGPARDLAQALPAGPCVSLGLVVACGRRCRSASRGSPAARARAR